MARRVGGGRVPLREPTGIVARPSVVTVSRVMWLVGVVVLSVTLVPGLGLWTPWMVVPLLVVAAVTGGPASAAAWAVAGGLALDLAPPASGTPGLGALPALAAGLTVSRVAHAWDDAIWIPTLLGALGSVVASLTVVALRVAAAGAWELDVPRVLAEALTTGALTALVGPAWVAWTRRRQQMGRG